MSKQCQIIYTRKYPRTMNDKVMNFGRTMFKPYNKGYLNK
ncbi:hypothetical protein SSCHL_0272 [Staphylococcus schleiferi]|nr:hypothetical protein SSCHL_0272 [Staphylococcus schleiferi]